MALLGRGGSVGPISAPPKEGHAFLGWYRDSVKWDFSSSVETDMVLTATYLRIFHLDIDGDSVRPMIDCTASRVTVAFSDGFDASYDSTAIPAHSVDESGSVSVTAVTGDGTYSAVCHYTIENQATQDNGDDTLLYAALATVGIAIVGLAIWRFVL